MGAVKREYIEMLERDRIAHDDELDAEYDTWLASLNDMESERFARTPVMNDPKVTHIATARGIEDDEAPYVDPNQIDFFKEGKA